AGMDDYVSKPIRLDELRRALERCRARAAAVVDLATLAQLGDELGSLDAVRDVVATFLEQGPAMVARMRDAAARADASGLRAAAPALKGTSATLGVVGVARLCADLEGACRAGDLAGTAAQVDDLESAWQQASEVLRAQGRRAVV